MRSHPFQALLAYAKTHLNRKRCRTVLVALACVVVFGTTYALILPAVTMTPELICDKPEHEHTADCYEQELVCDNEDPDHEHDDSCYEEVLICGEEEHQHNEDCYAFPEDEDPAETPEDTDDPADAPEEVPDADEPEDPEDTDEPDAPAWEADLPDPTGNWAKDVVAVARSQLDNEDLSRYVDAYTARTGADEADLDTTAPFAAFCLYYAGVDERDFPQAGSAGDWFDLLAEEDRLGNEIPAPGDLLFYENEGIRMGIVTDVDVSDDEEYTYTILESDLEGAVGESEHLHDFNILGYAPLPENPDEDNGSETPEKPDQPADKDTEKDPADGKADSDGKDQDQKDQDPAGADGDKDNEEGKPDAEPTPEDPAEEDTLPAVPKYALSATDEARTLQVTVQTALCTEHDHLGSTPAKPRYQPGDEAQGTITLTATSAESAEDDQTTARVYLAFENNTGSTELPGAYTVNSENGHHYTYTVEQVGESNTYYFDLPRPAPGDQVKLPFAARYLVSTEHGGKATLWCTVLTDPALATQEQPKQVKTLTWESDLVELNRLPAGTYGNFTLSYNETRNAFTTDPQFSKYYHKNHPLGVAGSFSIVAFDTLNTASHCNGNILANNLMSAQAIGTNQATDELSYILNYKSGSPNNAPSLDHILVVGSNNIISKKDGRLAISNQTVDRPGNIIQDTDSQNNPFIDLTEVRNEITTISERLAQQPDKGVDVDFHDFNDRSLIIDRAGGAHYWNTTLAQIIEFSNEIKVKIPEIDGNLGSVIVNVDCTGYQGKTISLPNIKLWVNGGEIGSSESKDPKYGAVIWNFVNAENVTFDVNVVYGAIIAPDATIITHGNVDGTIVGDKVTIGGESHRTDFTGTLTPTDAEFHFKKQVDGQRPSIHQAFQFTLEEWSESSSNWTTVETKENLYDDILFTPIEYTSSSDVGDHWYRVREIGNLEGYQYDSTQYYVKVVVTEEPDGPLGDTILAATYSYYSSSAQNTDNTPPDTISMTSIGNDPTDHTFRNTTDNGAHTLPSTGGPGEWTIPSIGILLMAGSLLVVSKQRPQRKEDR